MSEVSDFDAEVLQLIRDANARRRGYADFYKWPLDRCLEEVEVARTMCDALSSAGQPLAHSVVSRDRGSDPPDCEGLSPDGKRIAIEVTELVDPAAIVATRSGTKYVWAQWDSAKLAAALQERLSSKDGCKLKGGPYDLYVVVIYTDEPELSLNAVKTLLGDKSVRITTRVDRAYLLLSYESSSRSRPYVELQISDT